MNVKAFVILFLTSQFMLVGFVWAQAPIVGRVTDGVSQKPVPFASVYINASTRGTTADAEGQYKLPGVPAGTVEIVASAVGYETVRQTIRLGDIKNRRISFMLAPDAKALKAVTVKAKRPAAYNRMLKQFKRELLGDNSTADKCLITNIEAVSLSTVEGRLEASASEPLVIENNALGYRLIYQLLYFDSYRGATFYAGTSRFEAMKSQNNEQTERWERNRQRVYLGSSRHLLASLLAGTYEQEGFLVYESRYDVPADPSVPIAGFGKNSPTKPVKADSLFTETDLPLERNFYSLKPLEVFYTRQRALSPYRDLPYTYSLVHMPKGPATVTTAGWVVSPNGMEMRGALGNDRLATLLPADWQPVSRNAKLEAPVPDQGMVMPPDAVIDSLATHWLSGQKNGAPVLFLQPDKGIYATGDRLWFGGLVLDPIGQLPVVQLVTDQELPVHVELVAPGGQLVAHEWVRVNEGRVSGNFQLADSLVTGQYKLRAYTEADRNNSRPAFERNVTIINGIALGTDIKPTSSARIDVQFLPEGGRWVAGLPARLGIKAIDQRGRGVAISGRILSGNGRDVVRFATNAVGLGSVSLLPVARQTYTAQVRWASDSAMIALPTPDSVGLVLATDIVTDSTRLTIRVRSSALLAAQPVYLTLQSRGQLVQQTKLQLQNGHATLAIPAANLPVGVMQVTLFDALGHPQAERLVFIPDRFLPVVADVLTNKPTYGPRELVTLSCRLADGLGEQLSVIGSVAITDAQQVPNDSVEANIHTHLLLTGELRGRVELANEYLSNNERDVRRVLDNLLLTQGWRRINWRLAADKPPIVTPAPSGLVLTGQVFDKKEQPVTDANLLVTFSGKADNALARTAHTDHQGRFRLDKILLTDTVLVHLRAMTADFTPIANTHFVLDAPGKLFAVADSGTLPVPEDLMPFIANMQQRQGSNPSQYRSQGGQQSTMFGQVSKPDSVDRAKRLSRYGTVDLNVVFDKDARTYKNAYEMMAGNIPGVQVKKRPASGTGTGGYTVRVQEIGSPEQTKAPLYLIDGVALPENEDGTALQMVSLTNVERIDVIKNGVAGGLIAFHSAREKAGTVKEVTQHEPELLLYGLQTDRQFYTPLYTSRPDSATYLPDWRDVLYWQPMLTTSLSGFTTLTFPLSDSARTIRVRLQGVTTYGRPVSISRLINVR